MGALTGRVPAPITIGRLGLLAFAATRSRVLLLLTLALLGCNLSGLLEFV